MSVASLSPVALVQAIVDQASPFHFFRYADQIRTVTDGDRTIGFETAETWRRFCVSTIAPARDWRIDARNVIGEPIATSFQRYLFAPDEFDARPGRIPPPTAFDTFRSQRFTIVDAECRFGAGDSGFQFFGTGLTVGGSDRTCSLATAIATVVDGFGIFRGHEDGTLVSSGRMSHVDGFTGSLMIRVADRQRMLTRAAALPPIEADALLAPDAMYVVFRGEAAADDPVVATSDPAGNALGLRVTQQLKLQYVDCALADSLMTQSAVGERIGTVTASVVFDPSIAAGTLLDPVPFTAYDEFTFTDRSGRVIGSFTADSSEGRVFNMSLGGVPAIRFGGAGRLRHGTGPFSGVSGLMTDNSVVAFAPHVSASLYVLRISSPKRRLR
jgi:hypothetical protein